MTTPRFSMEATNGAPDAAGDRRTSREPWRMLIVDDSPDDRSHLRQMLLQGSERRCLFTEADRGSLAVDMLLSAAVEHEDPRPFSCMILDFHLPDMDALEVLTALRGHNNLPPCPIIVITGWDGISRQDGAQLLRAGAQDYIGKRWTSAESLNRSVENSIERFELLTTRKQTEVTLRAQADALADADRRKDEFLAMLGHELRNPLAPLRNALQVLKTQHDDEPRRRQALQMMERQVAQLTRLVEDLLDVSRFTTGMFRLRLAPCTIGDIVERAVSTTESLVLQRAHSLMVSVPAAELFLLADAARLEQVVVNLLTNAVKYSDAGGSIWVSVERDGDVAVLRVRDTGIGISPALLPRIFDLFSQAEQSLDRSEGGLGVGLCLVQRLVALHLGSIEVSSVVGQGSEFVVRLPLKADRVESLPVPLVLTLDVVRADRTLRILIVDDNVDAAESLGMLLDVAGVEIWLAHDGEAALIMALAHPPDVVLLDIGLPLLDGYEVARRMRLQTGLADVVIVGITGYGHARDRDLSTSAGFNHHLLKPVDLAVVQNILAKVVR